MATIKDFPGLVRWLVETRHEGVYYSMAKRLGISTALVYQWRDGIIKRPSDQNLEKIIRAYKLDPWQVRGAVTGDYPPGIKPLLGMLIAGLVLFSPLYVKSDAYAAPAKNVITNAPYRKFLWFLWWVLIGGATRCRVGLSPLAGLAPAV